MENNKLDNLIKLGIGMILLSGIIFVTTSWNTISDIAKLLFISSFGGITGYLSYFTDKKLNLPKSSLMYFILSLISFFVAIIGAAYFKMFGNWFSFVGDGVYTLYALLSLYIGIAFILINKKSDKEIWLDVSWIFILIAIYLEFMQFDFKMVDSLVLLSVFLNLLRIPDIDNKYFKNIKNVIDSYLIVLATLFSILTVIFINNLNEYLFVLGLVLFLGNFLYDFAIKNKDNMGIVISLFSVYSIIVPMFVFKVETGLALNIVSILLLLFYAIFYFVFKDRKQFIANNITLYNIVLLIVLFLFDSYVYDHNSLLIPFGIYTFLLCGYNFYFGDMLDNQSETSLRAIKVIFLMYTIIYQFDLDLESSFIVILPIFYLLILLEKSKKNKEITAFLFNLGLVVSLLTLKDIHEFTNIDKILYVENLILIILDSLLLNKDNKDNNILLVIILVIQTALIRVNAFGLEDIVLLGINYLFIVIMAYISKLEPKDKIKVCACYGIIPVLVYAMGIANTQLILSSYLIVVGILLRHFLLKEEENLYKLFFVLASLILFTADTVGLIIMWCLQLYILFTYYETKEDSLFRFSSIYFIITIVLRLFSFWTSIPLWLYLFIGGILIVLFVTRKELTKSKEEPKKEEVKQEIKNNNEINNFCPHCGNKLIGSKTFCTNCGNKCN